MKHHSRPQIATTRTESEKKSVCPGMFPPFKGYHAARHTPCRIDPRPGKYSLPFPKQSAQMVSMKTGPKHVIDTFLLQPQHIRGFQKTAAPISVSRHRTGHVFPVQEQKIRFPGKNQPPEFSTKHHKNGSIKNGRINFFPGSCLLLILDSQKSGILPAGDPTFCKKKR